MEYSWNQEGDLQDTLLSVFSRQPTTKRGETPEKSFLDPGPVSQAEPPAKIVAPVFFEQDYCCPLSGSLRYLP